jgi:hypothetical protein
MAIEFDDWCDAADEDVDGHRLTILAGATPIWRLPETLSPPSCLRTTLQKNT